MAEAQPNPYLKTKILTASPEELRLMLFDGAIRFAEKARVGLADKNFEAVYEGVTRCQNILLELMNGLRPEHDPELCQRLSALYTFMFTELMKASHDRAPDRVENVLKLLRYERETWQMLIDKLREENRQAAGAETAPAMLSAAKVQEGTPASSAAALPAARPGVNRPAVKPSLVGGTLSVSG